MKYAKLVLIILVSSNFLYGQPSRQKEKNMLAFTRLYGYVRYFHPSDEAQKVNWNRFAIFGSREVIKATDDSDLVSTLRKIFTPFAPSVEIFASSENHSFQLAAITPPKMEQMQVIYWQHLGIYTYGNNPLFSSIRVNRKTEVDQPYLWGGGRYHIAEQLDLRPFAGEKFKITMDILNSSPAASGKEFKIEGNKNSDMFERAKPYTLSPGEKKQISFSGVLGNDDVLTNFMFNMNAGLNASVSVENVNLSISQQGKQIPVPLSSLKGRLEKSVGSKVYAFDIGLETDERLFDRAIEVGERLQIEIAPGISIIVPLALYGDKNFTYPRADSIKLIASLSAIDEGVDALRRPNGLSGNQLEVRLANIVLTWNVLQHSFPYWKDSSKPSIEVLKLAIRKCFSDKNDSDFLETLKLMTAPLNDGHFFIDKYEGFNAEGTVPILLDKFGGKIAVKGVLADTLKDLFGPGDIIKKINNIPVTKLLKKKEKFLSGSTHWKESKALTTLLNDSLNSKINIQYIHKRKRRSFVGIRNSEAVGYRNGATSAVQPKTGWIKPGIFYFDLTKDTLTTKGKLIAEFKKASHIIFDLRGYPCSNENYEKIIPLLLKDTVLDRRFSTPQIVYPDYKNVFYWDHEQLLKPDTISISSKFFFLTDATAQSAAETILGRVKDFSLATIIGERTSGTNGNINSIYLPGRFSVSFSARLCKNLDGSKHHLVGIIPDYIRKHTLKELRAGKDGILEFAIKLAQRPTHESTKKTSL